MQISARNILEGTVVDAIKGATTSHVRIDIGGKEGIGHHQGLRRSDRGY